MGRRSKYFVKKKLQMKIFLLLILIALIILVMAGVDVILIKNNFYMDPSFVIASKGTSIPMSIMIFVNVCIIIGCPLLFTHKIAGPIYRLEIEMERIGHGDFSNSVKLRKGDFLTEIAVSLNGMQDSMKYRLGNIKKTVLEFYNESYSEFSGSKKERLEYLKGLVDDLIIDLEEVSPDESPAGDVSPEDDSAEEMETA